MCTFFFFFFFFFFFCISFLIADCLSVFTVIVLPDTVLLVCLVFTWTPVCVHKRGMHMMCACCCEEGC